jgi:acetylornithine/succinyldiaminopimelate/putrescine aminotransferase
MSNFILNEGYQQNKENLFNKGKGDLIFIDKKKYIDLSFCAGANLLGHNTGINKKILRKYLNKNISNFAAPNIYAYNYAKTLKYLLPQFSSTLFRYEFSFCVSTHPGLPPVTISIAFDEHLFLRTFS